ncbi:MAG: MFS transporter, partial [Pseudonocardiales bacterium]|nr:MFS transporter [Pseudonocardiales bacterium]
MVRSLAERLIGKQGKLTGFRYFWFLAAGNAFSSYGSYLNLIVLNIYTLQVTGSATQTGLVMATRLLVGFLTGLVSGSIVSRFNRKLVMICGDLAQAAALVALLSVTDGAKQAFLYLVAVVAGAGGTLSQVALRSSVPVIVGQDQRVRANGLLTTGRSLAMMLGFASSAVILSAFGYQAAFLIDAATFVVSAANLAWLPIRTSVRETDGPDTSTRPASPLIGLGILRSSPILLQMIAIRTVDGFGSASHNVGLPIFSTALDPAHPAAFMGRFLTTWAIGNILMQRALVRYVRRTGCTAGERAFACGT